MSSPSDNILQQVITYNKANLALLQNLMPFVSQANTKFKNFNTSTPQNLGSTVAFDLPPRFTTNSSLVITFQAATQRIQQLTVSSAKNTAYVFSAEQFIFNVEDYMEIFGRSAMAELAANVEASVASICETTPYRYYGDGTTPVTSYTQIAQALAQFRNFGAAQGMAKVFLSDTMIPTVIGNGLGQFVPERNEEIANSWELGKFSNAEYFVSNFLPVHISGPASAEPAGNLRITAIDGTGTMLTLHSTDQTTVTNFILANDNATIVDSSTSNPLRFLTFVGHQVSNVPVQFRVVTGGNLDGSGNITVQVYPPLISTDGDPNQNLSKPLVFDGSMSVSFLPTHRCAMILGGNAFYIGMPKLPDEVPYPTGVMMDPETGVSLRTYYGSLFGQDQRGMVHDVIWGQTAVPEYTMKIALPVSATS